MWTISKHEINSLNLLTNSTLDQIHLRKSTRTVFLDVQTYFKATETFQYTHFSLCHPLSLKKGFIKRETLCLLRTNSIEEKFETYKLVFQSRLLERGYPRKLVEKTLAEVVFSSPNEALKNKINTSKNILPFVTTFNPAVPKLKEILMKNWFLISNAEPRFRRQYQF